MYLNIFARLWARDSLQIVRYTLRYPGPTVAGSGAWEYLTSWQLSHEGEKEGASASPMSVPPRHSPRDKRWVKDLCFTCLVHYWYAIIFHWRVWNCDIYCGVVSIWFLLYLPCSEVGIFALLLLQYSLYMAVCPWFINILPNLTAVSFRYGHSL